jgi:hypothetical protein
MYCEQFPVYIIASELKKNKEGISMGDRMWDRNMG